MDDLLNRMETEFEEANVQVGEATWNTYSGEGPADLDAAHQRITAILLNSEYRRTVEGGVSQETASGDPLLARRFTVWRRCMDGAAVDNTAEILLLKNTLQRRIASFQFELDGMPIGRSELQRIVRSDPDREKRRRAWHSASALARANHDDLLRLVRLRNERARAIGYRDYVDLVFRLQDLDETSVHSMLDRVAQSARPAYARLVEALATNTGTPTLAPWDVQFAMSDGFRLADRYFPAEQALGNLRLTARSLGFDVERLSIRAVVRDIPFGGYNVAVRIPTDTRFLVNPSEGQAFYTTTFHEYGHSLQAVFTGTPWPILKEYEWVTGGHTAAFSEGMAEVMGNFTRRHEWLSRAGVPAAEVEAYDTRILPAQALVRFFELLLNMRIELAAYSEAHGDMSAIERNLNAGIRLLDYPADAESLWEANTWYTSYPVYWQNYILASMIADQVHEAMELRFGSDLGRESGVADYLCESFYRSGNGLSWTERLIKGTGRSVAPDAFLCRLNIPHS